MEGAFDFLSSLCFIVDTLIPFRALKKRGKYCNGVTTQISRPVVLVKQNSRTFGNQNGSEALETDQKENLLKSI